MDRTPALLKLTQAVGSASRAADWAALETADAAVAAGLRTAAAQGAWMAAELDALRRLRDAHQAAVGQCARAATELEHKLDGMRANKEGWLAYAVDQEGPA